MPKIFITAEAHQALRSAALFPFKETGVQLPSGEWEIPLQQETINRIKEVQFSEETLSDTILRLCATRQGSVQ